MIDLENIKSYLRIQKRLAPTTVRKRVGLIKIFLQYCTLNKVLYTEAYDSFLYESSSQISEAQLNNYIKAIKDLEDFLCDKLDKPRFLKRLKYFKRKRLTIEPLNRLEKDLIQQYTGKIVRACNIKKNEYIQALYKDFTLFLDMVGMRFEDAANITASNIYSDAIVFIQQKTKRTIKIPIEEPLISVLTKRAKDKKPEDLVFITNGNKKIIRHKYSEWLKEAGEAMGIKDFTNRCHPHNLRRAFANDLMHSGVHLKFIKDLMGHADISTTDGYLYSNEEDLRESIKKLPLAKRHNKPQDVVKDLLSAILSFKLDQDNRFKFKLLEENEKLMFELEVLPDK